MTKKILIIGGGIAGLTAGCYAQMNGYDTEIFEMHNVSGGLCTAWKRKGYTFDGCIHWLVGSNPSSPFYNFWTEVGVLEGKEIIQFDELYRLEDETGRTCIIYSNLDKLEQHLLELSPSDETVIREFIRAIRHLSQLPMPVDKPQELFTPLDLIKLIWRFFPYLKDFKKYNQISVADLAAKFHDPLIREAFSLYLPPYSKALNLLITLAWFHNQDAGFPLGGSLEFAQAITKRYQELGGMIHYKARVEKILVKNNKAVGLKLSDGDEFYGDFIFSSANGYATMFKLLDGKFADEKLKGIYEKMPTLTSMQVSLGIDYDLSGEPHTIMRKLNTPVILGGQTIDCVSLKNYSYDSSLSPVGRSVVVSIIEVPFSFWQNLAENPEEYKAEKERAAQLVIEELANRYSGTRGKVEVVDVVTPMTYVRYTDAWQGAYMSWMFRPEAGNVKIPRTLPGLEGLYMIGQWTSPPGGLPSAILSARSTVQILCKREKKTFKLNK